MKTALKIPMVTVPCRRLAAALLTLGAKFCANSPRITRIVAENGKRKDREDTVYYFDATCPGGKTHSLVEAWDDVESQLKENGQSDATKFFDQQIEELKEATAGNPKAKQALDRLIGIIGPVIITHIRCFVRNYTAVKEAECLAPAHEVKFKIGRMRAEKRSLQAQKEEIDRRLREIDKKLAGKAPPIHHPKLALYDVDTTLNARSELAKRNA